MTRTRTIMQTVLGRCLWLPPFLGIALLAFGQSPSKTGAPRPALKPPPVAECFKVDSMKPDHLPYLYGQEVYAVEAHSECPYTINSLYVGVKYFDKDGFRIGVGYWMSVNVTPGEKIRHTFPVLDESIKQGALSSIKTALITNDPVVANEFYPLLRAPSTSLVIDNLSGTVQNFEKK